MSRAVVTAGLPGDNSGPNGAARGLGERAWLRKALKRMSTMTPTQRQVFLQKLDRWRELSPRQREKVKARVRKQIRENRTRTK